MQTITTKYLPATNTRGSRIKATASGGESFTFPYQSELGIVDNHIDVVKRLCEHLKWNGTLAYDIQGGGGYVFVFVREGNKVTL